MTSPRKWKDLIYQWVDGAIIEQKLLERGDEDWKKVDCPNWTNPFYEFRIHDPYRELKAAADPEKEIRYKNNSGLWDDWTDSPNFDVSKPVDRYEIRDKPKEKKIVKSECWRTISNGELTHRDPQCYPQPKYGWQRFPAGDIEGPIGDEE